MSRAVLRAKGRSEKSLAKRYYGMFMSSIAIRLEYITKNGTARIFVLSTYFERGTTIRIDPISLQQRERERERENESSNTRTDHLRKHFDLLL